MKWKPKKYLAIGSVLALARSAENGLRCDHRTPMPAVPVQSHQVGPTVNIAQGLQQSGHSVPDEN
jgi:hypothetical protein